MSGERICFVSGHMDLTKEEFTAHYEPRIREAHRLGARFVVGDANGCDFMAQRLLHKLESGQDRSTGRVRVFHMLERPRHSFGSGYGSNDPNLPKETWQGRRGGFPLVGGFTSDDERDAAMTAASTEDIAWVRPVKSKRNSGTAKNLARRERLCKEAYEREKATWPRYRVEDRLCDDGEHRICIDKPTADDPGVPIPQHLVDQLERAEALLADAECDVRKFSNRIRGLVAEDEASK